MTKKILWMFLSFLLVAALVLPSCAKEEVVEEEEEEEEVVVEEEEAEEEEEEEPAVGVPQYGGTVTNFIDWGSAATVADVTLGLWPTILYISPVCEYLISGDFEQYGPRGTGEYSFRIEREIPEQFCKGNLAESWEVTVDKLTFHIRQGVHWAAYGKEHVMESRELTAEDVAWSLNRYFDSAAAGNGTRRTENGGWVESIYTEGDTVVVELSAFNANWLVEIGKGWGNSIYAPEVAEAGASDWDNLVGTGPFIVKECATGSHLSYERNSHYWDKTTINGKEYEIPFVDELVWPFIPDQSTRIAALRTGAIDVSYAVPLEYTDTLKATSPELLTCRWPHTSMHGVALKCDREPTSNKEVRRALMIAIDREAIVRATLKEANMYGWPINQGAVSIFTPIDELPPETQELFEYDPDKARQMLADAGYPNGFDLGEIVVPSHFVTGIDMITMVAAYWGEIGVEVTPKPMDPAGTAAYRRSGDYICIEWGASNGSPLTTFRQSFFWGPGVSKPTSEENSAYYHNPYLDTRYQEALQTVDTVERDAILKEIAVIALDDVPYIPIGAEVLMAYWWPWVKNYYGEMEASAWNPALFMAYAWIDQDLKAEMGY